MKINFPKDERGIEYYDAAGLAAKDDELKPPPNGIINKKCIHGIPLGLREYCKDCQLMDLESKVDALQTQLDKAIKALTDIDWSGFNANNNFDIMCRRLSKVAHEALEKIK